MYTLKEKDKTEKLKQKNILSSLEILHLARCPDKSNKYINWHTLAYITIHNDNYDN